MTKTVTITTLNLKGIIMRKVIAGLCIVYLILIFGAPLLLCVAIPLWFITTKGVLAVWLLLCPFIYTLSFVLTAGLLSLPWQRAIVPGKFPCDLGNIVYASRRLYNTCWTAVFYFKPIYFLCLSIDLLKTLLFRLFGYRGSMNFTIYPDSWIRDLPLLKFEDGVYIANRATVATNMHMRTGDIIVNTITAKKNALIGHLAMLAPGLVLGENSEIGAGCIIGINAKIGDGCNIGPAARVGHFTVLEDQVIVGSVASIGTKSSIAKGIFIPSDTTIPGKTQILTQEEANNFIVKH